jgi:predicted MFS family arabinose efflux permease
VTLRWVARERFASTASLVIALAGGAGAVLATAPLALSLDTIGWRATFALVAAVTGAFTVAVYMLVGDRPDATAARPSEAKESLVDGLAGMLAVFRRREFRLILPMTLCTSAPYFTVVGLWAGPYLRDVHGLSPLGLGYVLLAAIVGWNVGILCYGPLDRLLNTRKGVVLGGAGVVALVLAALALLPGLPLGGVTALLLVFALAAPFQITLAAHVLGFLPPELAGRGIAATQLSAITGVFVIQLLTGLLIDLFAAPGEPAPAAAYRLIFGFLAVLVTVACLAYSRAPDVPPRAA